MKSYKEYYVTKLFPLYNRIKRGFGRGRGDTQCDRARDRRAPQRAQAGGSTETLFSLIPATTIMGISGMKSGGSVTNSWDEVQENRGAPPEAGCAVHPSHDAQERLMRGVVESLT